MSEQQLSVPGARPANVEVFSFGDDVGVLDGQSLWGFFEGAWICGQWYEPPVPFHGLAKSYRMSPHHQSAIKLKVNLLKKHFVPSRWMDAAMHERAVLDYLQMGNLFLQEIRNLAKRPLRYEVSPALHTRVGVEQGRYFWVRPDTMGLGSVSGDYEFPTDSVIHLREPDVAQEIYGLPEWLSALQSGLLNESATLFRRRYYKNGGHAGYIFLNAESVISDDDWEKIKAQMRAASGRGNFKNLFIHMPGGKTDNIKVVPLAEVAAKDEFMGIKNVSRDDMLAAHRVPPQLIGVIPQNNGGFGDVRSAVDVFFANEIEPIMRAMEQVNEISGLPVVQYREYQPMGASAAA